MEKINQSFDRISIVVPVYRSALILPHLIDEIINESTKEGYRDNLELILVNDSSPDNSWQLICALSKKHNFIKGISLRRNFGQHNAIMAGLSAADGEYIIIMDDDLQHSPSEIKHMLRAIKQGFDVCYTKYLNRHHATWKVIGSHFNNLVATHLLGKPSGLYLSSFKAMRRGVADEITKYDGPYPYIDGLILDVTSSITTIDIEHQPRKEGDGNYNIRSSISLWLKMATSFSVLPLRLATYLGFMLTGSSLAFLALIIVNRFLHPEYPDGWASLIATVLFIGGIQTFCIGMMGEYLGRAYLKLNHKPQYAIKDRTWCDNIHESTGTPTSIPT